MNLRDLRKNRALFCCTTTLSRFYLITPECIISMEHLLQIPELAEWHCAFDKCETGGKIFND